MPLTRSTAAAAAALIAAGTLSVVTGTTSTASAACAPAAVVASHATASKKVAVRTTTTVRKARAKRFVAQVRVSARQGSATVSLTQTVCPDGVAGAGASTTQRATGAGMLQRAVSAKGRSRAVAKKAARAKAKRTIARIRTAGATKRGRAAAKRRAIATARAAAAVRAHRALFVSSVYWLGVHPSTGRVVVSATRPAGASDLTARPNGDLVLTVPAGADASGESALACVRRAPAWPSAFLGAAAGVDAPALARAADLDDETYAVAAVPVSYAAGDEPGLDHTGAIWSFGFDGSAGGPVVQLSHFEAGGSGVEPFAGTGLCFGSTNTLPVAATVTFRGLRVSSRFNEGASSATVIGGVPVEIG